MSLLFDSLIDKVYIFLDSSGAISYVLPVINLEFIVIAYLVCITIKFVADTSVIFISGWRSLKYGKLRYKPR